MTSAKTTRFCAAIHEAGHAIVMQALGVAVGVIEIGIDGDETKGRTDRLSSDEHLPILDRIAICQAGIEAQHVFQCPTHELAGVSDHAKVIELLEDVPDSLGGELRQKGYCRARELILRHQAKLLGLAERLADKGRVTAEEFATLVAD